MNYKVTALWKNRKGFPLRTDDVGIYGSKVAAEYTIANIMQDGIYVKEIRQETFKTEFGPESFLANKPIVHKKLFPNELSIEPTEDSITVSEGTVEKHIIRTNMNEVIRSSIAKYRVVSESDIEFYKVPPFFKKPDSRRYNNGRTHT